MTLLLNVTIPVFNEQEILAKSTRRVIALLDRLYENSYELVIADNASTDRTWEIAKELEREVTRVRVLHLTAQGRGRALKKSWTESRADILSYMDVDLSTELEYFPILLEPLRSGAADLAVGSRLLKLSSTTRGMKREMLSRGYNILVRSFFGNRFSDAQCGFKALTRRAADELVPLVVDDAWFFDTELLLWAEQMNYRVYDLPVKWIDDPDSRVKILRTALADIKGLLRLRRTFKRMNASEGNGLSDSEEIE